jgi:hypothetical protein
MTDTPLPDVLCQKGQEDGCVILVANKKARRFLNDGFDKPRPQWQAIGRKPDSVFNSPEYRAMQIERGPCLCAMLWALHDAGLTAMYWCDSCDRPHLVTDAAAEVFKHQAISGAAGVHPGTDVVQ